MGSVNTWDCARVRENGDQEVVVFSILHVTR